MRIQRLYFFALNPTGAQTLSPGGIFDVFRPIYLIAQSLLFPLVENFGLQIVVG